MASLITIEYKYPLNEHTKVVLRLGPNLFEPTYDDIPTNGDKLHTGSDVDSNLEDEDDKPLALEDVEDDDVMEY